VNLTAVWQQLTALLHDIWHDFVWADIRRGLVDLHGLSRPTQALVLFGFTLLGIMLLVLLASGFLRAAQPLIPLAAAWGGARGEMLPQLLIPLTLFLVALAWSFLLAGALHCHPLLRLAVLLLYLVLFFPYLSDFLAMELDFFALADWYALLRLLLALLGLASVLIFSVVRWWGTPRPAFEFAWLLSSVTLTLAMSGWQSQISWQLSGIPLGLTNLETAMLTFGQFILPFLILAGLNIADFTVRASNWTTAVFKQRLPVWTVYAALAGLLGWRLLHVGTESITRIRLNGLPVEAWQYAGALGEVLLVWGVAWLVWRWLWSDMQLSVTIDKLVDMVAGYAIPLILIFLAPFLTIFVLIPLLLPLQLLTVVGLTWLDGPINAGYALYTFLSASDMWPAWVALGAIAAAVIWRRRLRLAALYLLLFGTLFLWSWFTRPEQWLNIFYWRGPEPLDFWWLLLLAGLGLYWQWRGRLDHSRAGRLLLLTVMLTLLRQTQFIENPFSPFLAFAGIGFLAFAIGWDMVKIGAWANQSSAALPRLGRLLLYIGYVLLSVTVINWAAASHNLSNLDLFTGGYALLGLEGFGRPLLYALFPLLLWPTDSVTTSLERPLATAPTGAEAANTA
jgi:hypothetical protein